MDVQRPIDKKKGGKVLRTVGMILLVVSTVFYAATAILFILMLCGAVDGLPDAPDRIFGIANMFGVAPFSVLIDGLLAMISPVMLTILSVIVAGLNVAACLLIKKKGLKFYLIPAILTVLEFLALIFNVFFALAMTMLDGSLMSKLYYVPTVAKAMIFAVYIALYVRGVKESKYDYVLTEEEKEYIFK